MADKAPQAAKRGRERRCARSVELVFFAHAYARCILECHRLPNKKTTYEEIRTLMESAVSNAQPAALIVTNAGKDPRHPSRA